MMILLSLDKGELRLYMFNIDRYLNKFFCSLHLFNNGDKSKKTFSGKSFFIISVIIFIFLWGISGLYTIKEAERGVILRFGKYDRLVQPGLNWKPTFIDYVIPINIESVRELAASGMMLTSDENVVRVEMNVQYRVTNPKNYLFNVTDADDSLRQATDSALRGVIGKYNMDRILTEGRTVVRSDTRRILEKTIQPYNMGISLLDVNFQTARPPEEVKAAFDDAIAARENEQQYIREAEAYANEIQPKANGQAQRILEEGRAYKARTILEAQGEVQRFLKILPEYKVAPEITRKRLYINAMERILGNTRKVFIDSNNTKSILLLSSDKITSSLVKDNVDRDSDDYVNQLNKGSNLMKKHMNKKIINDRRTNNLKQEPISTYNNSSSYRMNSSDEILNQRKSNATRIDTLRTGRGSEGGEL